MKATFRFDDKALSNMDATVTFTTSFAEWKKISAFLKINEKDEDYGDVVGLHNCIKNIIGQVEEATGTGYRTHAYLYKAEKDDPKGADA